MFTRSRISWLSVLQLMGALAAVAAICAALYLREANQISQNALDREYRRMEIFKGLFGNDFSSVVSNLRQLSSAEGIQDYLINHQQTDFDWAVRRAVFYSKENPDYDQIRYLDDHGQELYRVNRNGVVVPADQLQNKADRAYFQQTWALGPDEVYISALDLNVEHGVLEQPLKPMLRFAVPVFDATGTKRGVYIINDLAANMIQRLRDFTPQYQQRFRLLNAQGYWLASDQPEEEWGFMIHDRSGMTLANTDPELWAKIASKMEGQESYHGGYFTWIKAAPGEFTQRKPVTLKAGDDYLVFASQVTPAEWSAMFTQLRETFAMVGILLLILTAVITWVLQGRRKLQQERDRFFDLAGDMLCVAGFDGYFKRVNPAWTKTLGYTLEEMTSKPFVDFVHPDDRKKTVEETASLATGGETVSFENRYKCKDGSYRWLSWSARSLVEEQVIYGSARDLTERRQIEEKLRQSEERSRAIIESAHDAFVSMDVEGRITDWNLRAETMFGWTHAEAVGQLLHETIIPPQYREGHQKGMKHLQATGEGPVFNKTLELSALRRNGAEFPVELVIWPMKRQGEITFHAFVRDITARKEAAESIEKLNGELKERANLLLSANKELEAFSYSVSHDLRAPLRHINGFVELLQKAPVFKTDEGSQRQMSVIAKAAKSMGQLIDDLLDFSRTGRAEMHPSNVDMRELIDEIIKDREMESAGRKITWEIKPMPKVAGDSRMLKLVWINLIDNAIKYTRPRAEAKIEIGHVTSGSNGKSSGANEVVFYVKDNGVGFDMQYATKLFGVFQRLHRPEDFEGTGIGLANVQRIIHRHGGRVWAEAAIDVGSTFYFSLPNKLTKSV